MEDGKSPDEKHNNILLLCTFMRSFDERVWQATKRIPRGKVSTYKEIAHALGCRAYRAVGQALNRNPHAPIVPCHRVVASDGTLGGFAHGPKKKTAILAKEGVHVSGGRIIDFPSRLHRLAKIEKRR